MAMSPLHSARGKTMELDLNKFRTLVPINALYEGNLMQLAKHARVERFYSGDKLFSRGEHGPNSAFLMSGSVKLTFSTNKEMEIAAGSKAANYALTTRCDAHVTSETANIVWINRVLLERLLAWGESYSPGGLDVQENQDQGPSAMDSEWMMAMLQTKTFLKLPANNIQTLFSIMQETQVKKGDVIVRFGDTGGFYYMVKKGRCQVSRPTTDGEEVLAEIGRGSSFGEESLIAGTPRNATITMLTDGTLMSLSKNDFIKLFNEPILNWIDATEARTMVQNGACMVDIRLDAEYKNSMISGAINIPLGTIRQKGQELDPGTQYILYCDTGQRSSTAAFLLSEMGLDVYVLKDGNSSIEEQTQNDL
ncbi:MAG: cyclic nucleotide-binding domain-containing protein [Gammaproteobacteria bacterium]|nr:cyclic nucleotide-binding domain-containing protein [Gammaproteobacteria bacterium]